MAVNLKAHAVETGDQWTAAQASPETRETVTGRPTASKLPAEATNVPPLPQTLVREKHIDATDTAGLHKASAKTVAFREPQNQSDPTIYDSPKHIALRKVLNNRKLLGKANTGDLSQTGEAEQTAEKSIKEDQLNTDEMNKPALTNTIVAAAAAKALRRETSNASTTPSLNNSFSSTLGVAEIKKKLKRVPKSTAEVNNDKLMASVDEEANKTKKDDKPEMNAELYFHLFEPLKDCSRQRLRAILMGLRKYATVESRVTAKELKSVLEENQVKVGSRSLQMLVEAFEDSFGIDYEKMWRALVIAQSKTGRDSVLAKNRRNDLETSHKMMTREQKDADLLRRLEQQLINSNVDLTAIRAACQSRDRHKAGKIPVSDVVQVFVENNLPIYGALLKSLLSRCDEEQNNYVSWSEAMNFLEKAKTQSYNFAEEPDNWRPQTGVSVSGDPSRPTTALSQSQTSIRGSARRGRGRGRGDGRGRAKSRPGRKRNEDADNPLSVPSNDENQAPDNIKPPKGTGVETIQEVQDTNNQKTKEKSAALSRLRKNASSVRQNASLMSTMKNLMGKRRVEDQEQILPVIRLERRGSFLDPITVANSVEETLPTQSQQILNRHLRLLFPQGPSVNGVTAGTVEGIYPPRSRSPRNPWRNPHTYYQAASEGREDSGKMTSRVTAKVTAKVTETQIKGKKMTFITPDSYDINKVSTDPPQQRLKLEWVYGYRGNDTRNNIFVLATGEIVYFIGTSVILYNKEQHTQRHYREHTQEIKCITVHPNGMIIATGQGVPDKQKNNTKGQAIVRIWRADTLQTLTVLGENLFTRSVIALSFSQTKDRICAIDASEGHLLCVFDMHSGNVIAQTNLKVEVILDCAFSSVNSDVIVTIGMEHLAWWCIMQEQATILLQYQADYGTYLRPKHVVSLLHNDKGDLLTGDSNGTVYVWGNGSNTITNFIKHGHEGPVFSLLLTRGTLITGGRDSKICAWLWGRNMDKSGEIVVPPQEGGVRMLQLYKDMILIGTTTNSIRSVKLSAQALKNPLVGVSLDPVPLTQGHFDHVDGLAAVQSSDTSNFVITAGVDGILSLLDPKNKHPVWKLLIKNTRVCCVDIDSESTMVVLGTKDSIVILDIVIEPGQGMYATETCRMKIGNGKITTVKFSPDFNMVAAGDLEGQIHILTWKEAEEEELDGTWKHTGSCQGHKGSITAIDWSTETAANNYIIRSTSATFELLYWDVEYCKKIEKPDEYRNVKWKTNHCLLDYGVSGIWHSKRAKEAEVSTVDVNTQQTLVVMGDDAGYISLFRYPCSKQGAYSHTYKSQTSVSKLVFASDGYKLLTVGGSDSSILQWTVV